MRCVLLSVCLSVSEPRVQTRGAWSLGLGNPPIVSTVKFCPYAQSAGQRSAVSLARKIAPRSSPRALSRHRAPAFPSRCFSKAHRVLRLVAVAALRRPDRIHYRLDRRCPLSSHSIPLGKSLFDHKVPPADINCSLTHKIGTCFLMKMAFGRP